MVPRLLEAPPGSFFLFGPRGTGKSTWLREPTHGAPKGKVIVIDEVQKVPALLHEVHALVEKDKERRFVLTGSSTRKLRRAGVDLLAGRLRLRSMHPFLAAELAGDFSVEKALESGLVPLVVDSSCIEAPTACVSGTYSACRWRNT
jgi:predicted AAA+ superfamily ATPase